MTNPTTTPQERTTGLERREALRLASTLGDGYYAIPAAGGWSVLLAPTRHPEAGTDPTSARHYAHPAYRQAVAAMHDLCAAMEQMERLPGVAHPDVASALSWLVLPGNIATACKASAFDRAAAAGRLEAALTVDLARDRRERQVRARTEA